MAMNEYAAAFRTGSTCLPVDCDLTGFYGRFEKGTNDDDFSRLSSDPNKRLSWLFDEQILRQLFGISHLDILLNVGHTLDWIRFQLSLKKTFKLIVCSLSSNEVKQTSWNNIFDLLTDTYPEIDQSIWQRYSHDLTHKTFDDIDPDESIIRDYWLGRTSDRYMDLNRFLALKGHETLRDVRAFLYHEIGLNELFQGDGYTVTQQGVITGREYFTRNRLLTNLNEYVVLDLNPLVE
jgi:hypothetical protein